MRWLPAILFSLAAMLSLDEIQSIIGLGITEEGAPD